MNCAFCDRKAIGELDGWYYCKEHRKDVYAA
jgi:hypothetical protein